MFLGSDLPLTSLLVAVGLASAVGGDVQTTSECLTNADSAARHQAAITHVVSSDSAQLVEAGAPYKPIGGVILVTSDSVCALAVRAFNATASDSAYFVSQAYVFQLGTAATAYAVNGGSVAPGVYEFYSSSWVRLFGVAGE
jgi:hypothetical protein